MEKTFPHPYCIPHPSLSLHMTQLQVPSPLKGNGHAPAFGIPLPGLPSLGMLDKDMGLGTSGEDSSEASSSKSQRRRAEEDERQRRK